MKTPKRIDDALKRRTRLANQLILTCATVDDWLEENGVDPDPACWLTGVEIYVNPNQAEREVRRAIAATERMANDEAKTI